MNATNYDWLQDAREQAGTKSLAVIPRQWVDEFCNRNPMWFHDLCREVKSYQGRVTIVSEGWDTNVTDLNPFGVTFKEPGSVAITFHVPVYIRIRKHPNWGFMPFIYYGANADWHGGWHGSEQAAREETHRVLNGNGTKAQPGYLDYFTEQHNIDCKVIDVPVEPYDEWQCSSCHKEVSFMGYTGNKIMGTCINCRKPQTRE